MQFIGVEQRAKQARAALNRLRWEVDQAIEQGRVNEAASMDLAEAVAIMARITQALDENLPEQPEDELQQVLGSARERFAEHLRFYFEYHSVGR
jgi:molybdopterin-binding protein